MALSYVIGLESLIAMITLKLVKQFSINCQKMMTYRIDKIFYFPIFRRWGGGVNSKCELKIYPLAVGQ